MGTDTISEELKIAFKEKNIDYYPIKSATPEEFYSAIEQAKHTNPHGAFVTKHSIEDYRKMRLFLTYDGTAGIAITEDNNIKIIDYERNGDNIEIITNKLGKYVISYTDLELEHPGIKIPVVKEKKNVILPIFITLTSVAMIGLIFYITKKKN